MNQECHVCGEPATGFHTGAFACEKCKVSIVEDGMRVRQWPVTPTVSPKKVRRRPTCPQVLAHRNARERRRVHSVNAAFAKLRQLVPMEYPGEQQLSKAKTLQRAAEYIASLLSLLRKSPCPHQQTWDHRTREDDLDDDSTDSQDTSYSTKGLATDTFNKL